MLMPYLCAMLTRKAKYAIKALVYLAQENRMTPIRQIAEQTRIPRKFLEAILLDLKIHGITDSKQGITGGYFLLRDANEINLAEIYRLLDGPIALVPCVSLNFYKPCDDCVDEAHCAIRTVMYTVRDAMIQVLEKISIGQIASGASKMP